MHSLLSRQLRRALGDSFSIPEEWQGLIGAVNDAYRAFDDDRSMLERSLELSSQELLQANSEMQAVFKAIPDLLFVLDRKGVILDCKAGNSKDLFREPSNLVGRRIQDVPWRPVADKFIRAIEQVHEFKSIISIEYSLPIQDEEHFFEARLAPLLEDQIIAIIRNITERKHAEEALRLARLIIENSPVVLFRWGANDEMPVELVSENVKQFGYLPEELLSGMHPYLSLIHPDDMDRVRRKVHTYSVNSVNNFQQEYRIITKDGRWRWLEDRTFVERDADGHATHFQGIVVDITERKQAEKEIRRLNEGLELRVIERTAQLGAANQELEAFAYSVSHDLRAPLRAINGFSLALLEDHAAQLDDEGKGFLERVRSASQRMGTLIDALLNLSRLTRSEMNETAVDLSGLACAIAAELSASQPKRQVEFVIAPGLIAQGDPHLIRVALDNLLRNAWKFTIPHATARIEVGAKEEAGASVYYVRDDGVGFDMAFADKLFGAFQRLHSSAEFEGTGIGLATVQRIIRRHGGRVWAEGKVDQGATIYFTLPGETGQQVAINGK
jgi:PAS domain S-box-containing protein